MQSYTIITHLASHTIQNIILSHSNIIALNKCVPVGTLMSIQCNMSDGPLTTTLYIQNITSLIYYRRCCQVVTTDIVLYT